MMKRPGFMLVILLLLLSSIETAVAQKLNTLTIALKYLPEYNL